MKRRALLRLLLVAPLLPAASVARAGARRAPGEKPHTPKPGSAERKLILDALRVPVQKDVAQPVIFEVRALNVLREWAFVNAIPTLPNGKPIDYRHTKYQDAIDAGAFDNWVCGLLHHTTKGGWKVVTYRLGATDVAYEDWDTEYHCPRAILGLPLK